MHKIGDNAGYQMLLTALPQTPFCGVLLTPTKMRPSFSSKNPESVTHDVDAHGE